MLYNIAEFAVERKCLESNPLLTFRWKAPKASDQVDRRVVVNPVQARMLLNAVDAVKRSGPDLIEFFGLIYFSALRPEEAVNVA